MTRNPGVATKPRRARIPRSRFIAQATVAWYRASRHPVASTVAIAAVSLASMLVITAAAGIPEPQFHDELAQLVQADIFAHGRLAEAPHPFWQHFETFHVLSQPTYQAKFPPG